MMAHMRNDATVEPRAESGAGLDGLREVGRALGDVGRLRILAALRDRELCVCHLTDLLGLDTSTVSRHVGALRRAGLVDVRKEGRWLHCRRARGQRRVFGLVDAMAAGDPRVAEDLSALQAAEACADAADCC